MKFCLVDWHITAVLYDVPTITWCVQLCVIQVCSVGKYLTQVVIWGGWVPVLRRWRRKHFGFDDSIVQQIMVVASFEQQVITYTDCMQGVLFRWCMSHSAPSPFWFWTPLLSSYHISIYFLIYYTNRSDRTHNTQQPKNWRTLTVTESIVKSKKKQYKH